MKAMGDYTPLQACGSKQRQPEQGMGVGCGGRGILDEMHLRALVEALVELYNITRATGLKGRSCTFISVQYKMDLKGYHWYTRHWRDTDDLLTWIINSTRPH